MSVNREVLDVLVHVVPLGQQVKLVQLETQARLEDLASPARQEHPDLLELLVPLARLVYEVGLFRIALNRKVFISLTQGAPSFFNIGFP